MWGYFQVFLKNLYFNLMMMRINFVVLLPNEREAAIFLLRPFASKSNDFTWLKISILNVQIDSTLKL